MRRYLKRHYDASGQPLVYFVSKKNDTVWFSVIYGLFPDHDTAKASIAGLPAFVRKAKPWVRRIGALREKALR